MAEEQKAAAPVADPPETPQPASQGAEGTPGGDGAAPTPEQLREQFQQAVGDIDNDSLKLLFDNIPEERREQLWGEDTRRKAQSLSDTRESAAELELRKTKIEDQASRELSTIRARHNESEDRERIGNDLTEQAGVIARTTNDLRRAELEHAMRSHQTWAMLTEDDKRKFSSVERQDDEVAVRVRLHTMLDRAYEAGRADAPAALKTAADKEAGNIDRLAKLLTAVKGSGEQVSSQQVASAPGGSDPERVARIASDGGTEDDARWLNEKYPGQGSGPRGA